MLSRSLIKLPVCFILGLLWLSFIMPGALAQTRTLDKDTNLHPQGWTVGDFVDFKKGTIVTFNDFGEVISGTLASDTFLRPRGWQRLIDDYYYTTVNTNIGFFYFHPFIDGEYDTAIPGYGHVLYKGGTSVTFSEKGDILAGTIAGRAKVCLVEGKYGFVTFRADSVLSFYESGEIMSGVLDDDTYLRPVGWRSLGALSENNNVWI